MNHRFFRAAACLLSLAASGIAQTNVTLNFQVAGKARSSVVHVPSGTNKPAVVFFVHGANGSGAGFQSETKGDVTADREKFIAVYPSATANGQGGVWDDMSGTGNFAFFLALLDTLDARYKIDRNRVYMTGFSQGGFISFVAACSYSNVFAAVAPVSGHSGATCALKRPVPVYMTFGAQEGAASFLKDRDVWMKADTCPATPPTIIRPYPASKPNSKVTRVAYGPCAQGSQVVVDSVAGQGHQWPSSSNMVMADEVWSFFKPFSLGAPTGVQSGRIAGGDPITVSYSPGMLRIDGPDEDLRVRVTDIHGRFVASGPAVHGRFAFKDEPSGLYVASVIGGGKSSSQKFMIP